MLLGGLHFLYPTSSWTQKQLENKCCELKRVKVFFIGVSGTDPSWASEEPPFFVDFNPKPQ